MSTQTFNTTGTWTCPAGVTSVQAECWGRGGDGGAFYPGVPDNPLTKANEFVPAVSGYGGGGGAYAKKLTITVVPSTVYTVHIGTTDDTWFLDATTVLAKKGQNGSTGVPGLGGSATDSIGDTKTPGSAGSTTTGGAAGNGGVGGADHTNGTAPGGGGGGDSTGAGAGTGAAGRVVLTWTDFVPPPDPTPSRNQIIWVG